MNELKLLQPIVGFVLVLIVVPQESPVRIYNTAGDSYGELWFDTGQERYLFARNSGDDAIAVSVGDGSKQLFLPDTGNRAVVRSSKEGIEGHGTVIVETEDRMAVVIGEAREQGGGRFVPKGLRIMTVAEANRWAAATGGVCCLAVMLVWGLARYSVQRAAEIQDE